MRVIPAFMCTALLPSLVVVGFVFYSLSIPPGNWFDLVSGLLFYYCFSLAITLFLGCPVQIILEKYSLRRNWHYVMAGAMIALAIWLLLDLNIEMTPVFYPLIILPPLTAWTFWFFNRPDLRKVGHKDPPAVTAMPAFKVWVGMLLIGIVGSLALRALQIIM